MSKIEITATWKKCWESNRIELWLGGNLWGWVNTKPLEGLAKNEVFRFWHFGANEEMSMDTIYWATSIMKDSANSHIWGLHSELVIAWPDENVLIKMIQEVKS